jgi:hypothetical protein
VPGSIAIGALNVNKPVMESDRHEWRGAGATHRRMPPPSLFPQRPTPPTRSVKAPRKGEALVGQRHPRFHQSVDDRGVGEGAGVAEGVGLAFGDLAENTTHDLAGARLRESRRDQDVVRGGDRSDAVANLTTEFADEVGIDLPSFGEDDVREYPLPLDLVREADDRRFGTGGVVDEGRFDLGGIPSGGRSR